MRVKVVADGNKKYSWLQKYEGFIADGIIDPIQYSKQKITILIILSETYGLNQCEVTDIEIQNPVGTMALKAPWVQTPRKIAPLLWLTFTELETNTKVEYNEFPNLFKIKEENYIKLRESILKVAWVNVKKAPKDVDDGSEPRQDYNEIYDNAIKNENILALQIKSITLKLLSYVAILFLIV